MKIAVILPAFHGGAAKSLMQYVNILIEEGHEVLVEGHAGNESIVQTYTHYGAQVKIFDTKTNDKNKLKVMSVIADMAKYALQWGSECIICVGLTLSYPISLIADQYHIKCLCIFPGGNLKSGSKKISKLSCSHLLVFSKENKKEVLQYGYSGDVTVISNRIPMTVDDNWEKRYYTHEKNNVVRLFMASRLDAEKINSIKYVINLAKWLIKQGINVKLDIAGEGVFENEVRQYIDSANHEAGKDIINFLGFQDNVMDCYLDADICFGKGRCILEPAMLGRYIVCVSEEDTCSIVTTKSYDNLSFFNFSGRNIENKNTQEDIKRLIEGLSRENYITDFRTVRDTIIQEYNAEKLSNRFYEDLFYRNYVEDSNPMTSKTSVHKISLLISLLKSRIRLIL